MSTPNLSLLRLRTFQYKPCSHGCLLEWVSDVGSVDNIIDLLSPKVVAMHTGLNVPFRPTQEGWPTASAPTVAELGLDLGMQAAAAVQSPPKPSVAPEKLQNSFQFQPTLQFGAVVWKPYSV